ncbi:DUF6896 domain-containing protein [Luteibacter yeojuensis]|uniref:DUF6896 domain-containing protein n=1 Tax=Luteibacter yeojuensis TaxID=345309 RepID=UPI003D18CFEA
MNRQLFLLIESYIGAVARAVVLLRNAGVPMPESNAQWAASRLPTGIVLSDNARFRKHGYGCEVEGPGWKVDFDFGDHGEINGFDNWRLRRFQAENDFAAVRMSIESLTLAFSAASAAGEIVRPGHHLYYLRRAPLSLQ